MDNENKLLNGVLKELIEATVEIGDRREQAATKARSAEDIAVDPWRLELSADYKKALAFLNGTKDRARELTRDIKRHTAEYDSIND